MSKQYPLTILLESPTWPQEAMASAFKTLRSWVDVADAKYSAACAAYEKALAKRINTMT